MQGGMHSKRFYLDSELICKSSSCGGNLDLIDIDQLKNLVE